MATLTDTTTGIQFPNLTAWLAWKESQRAACQHPRTARREVTTKRAVYAAVVCTTCGKHLTKSKRSL